ncbi:hypothetical protein [Desulfococcus sp.]|uniref:hypothetical protein n=1 Tax=Desulfococcus sp. TaxID=2025834 RepID=UPI003593CB24
MTPQSPFLMIAPVRDGQMDTLRALLMSMNKTVGHADPENSLVPFGRFDRLHVARFVILEAKTTEEIQAHGVAPYPWRPCLAFLGDCDGDRESFLAELAMHAGPGLTEIFSCCEGFSGQENDLLPWMQACPVRPQANYINWIGRTVTQVREEAALHRSLSLYLQEIIDNVDRKNTRALRQKLLSHVELEKHAGRLTLTPPAPTPACWKIRNMLHKIGIPLILLILSPLFVAAAPFFVWRLRMLERADPDIVIRPDRQHVRELSTLEDQDVSNQFNVFGDVKPGFFRLFTLRFLLLLVDYSARHVYQRGYLTRIRTIHFARWVLMDNNRRVFFASNYDGSHESYMDDFINKVAWGLNLVFSNGVGYPPTRWLVKDGATQEQKYKYTLRRHQLPSAVWYKAYPGMTAYDLSRNSRIREGVEVRPSSDAEIREWLSLI